MGLLDGNLDPQTIAQLQLAGGLLSPGSFGQGLSRGISGYQGALANSQNYDINSQKLAMEKLQFQMDMQKQQLGMKFIARLNGDGTQDQPPSNSQAALALGAQNGSVGPTVQNASAMNAMPPQQQATQSQIDPMTGLPSAQVGLDYLFAGGKNLSTMMDERTKPTPEMLNAKWMGYSPAQALAAKNAADLKAAEVERRPQNEFFNYLSGQSGIVPKIPENANPVGPISPNGAIPGGVSQLPGAAPVTQATAQANATGKTYGSPHTVTTSNGSTATGMGSDLFGTPGVSPTGSVDSIKGQIAAVRSNGGQPIDPKDQPAIDKTVQALQNQLLKAQSNGGNLFGPKVITGPSNSDQAIQKTAADAISNAPQTVASSRGAVQGLQNALAQVEGGIKTGVGTQNAVNAMALLNNLGVPLMKGDVDGYQTLQKYLQNSLNQAAAGTGASGSDARFESFMHGQPNADTMNPTALAGAIRYVLSQHDAAIARGTFLPQAYAKAQAAGDPNAALTAQSQWAAPGVFNPKYFELQRLAPAEQAKALNQMTPGQVMQFSAWRNAMGQK